MSNTNNNQEYLYESPTYSKCDMYNVKEKETNSSNVANRAAFYNRAIVDIKNNSASNKISIELNIKKIEQKEKFFKFNNENNL